MLEEAHKEQVMLSSFKRRQWEGKLLFSSVEVEVIAKNFKCGDFVIRVKCIITWLNRGLRVYFQSIGPLGQCFLYVCLCVPF